MCYRHCLWCNIFLLISWGHIYGFTVFLHSSNFQVPILNPRNVPHDLVIIRWCTQRCDDGKSLSWLCSSNNPSMLPSTPQIKWRFTVNRLSRRQPRFLQTHSSSWARKQSRLNCESSGSRPRSRRSVTSWMRRLSQFPWTVRMWKSRRPLPTLAGWFIRLPAAK